MIYINHRINTIQQLHNVPKTHGIELDLRYHKNDLILKHDPFKHHQNKPEKFVDLLKEWQHEGPMTINIKTEGIEIACINLIKQFPSVKSWFFLDLSMPYCVQFANKAFKREIDGFSPENIAIRFSEYEPIEYALSFQNKAKWVWVDCFNNLPLNGITYKQLKNAHFKLCIVSPELQKHPIERINEFAKQLKDMKIDAVCTKHPDLWQQVI